MHAKLLSVFQTLLCFRSM